MLLVNFQKKYNTAKPSDLFCNGALIKDQLSQFTVASLETHTHDNKPIINFTTKAQPSFNKQFDLLIENLNRISQQRIYQLYFLCQPTTSTTISRYF